MKSLPQHILEHLDTFADGHVNESFGAVNVDKTIQAPLDQRFRISWDALQDPIYKYIANATVYNAATSKPMFVLSRNSFDAPLAVTLIYKPKFAKMLPKGHGSNFQASDTRIDKKDSSLDFADKIVRIFEQLTRDDNAEKWFAEHQHLKIQRKNEKESHSPDIKNKEDLRQYFDLLLTYHVEDRKEKDALFEEFNKKYMGSGLYVKITSIFQEQQVTVLKSFELSSTKGKSINIQHLSDGTTQILTHTNNVLFTILTTDYNKTLL